MIDAVSPATQDRLHIFLNGKAHDVGGGSQILSIVGQPEEYFVLEEPMMRDLIRDTGTAHAPWEMFTYPARSAISIGRHEEAFTLVPDTDAFRAFLKAYQVIDAHYGVTDHLSPIWVKTPVVEPPGLTTSWEQKLLDQVDDIAMQLRRERRVPLLVATQTRSKITDEVIEALNARGVKASAIFPLKDHSQPSFALRDGFSSSRLNAEGSVFTEKYHIPAPPGIIIQEPSQTNDAYNQILQKTGQESVYIKLDASGGGYYTFRVNSAEEAQDTFNRWIGHGERSLVDGRPIPVEIQGLIPKDAIRGFYSFQYAGQEAITPGLGITEQIMQGDQWIGNVYNTQLESVPLDEREGTLKLIREFERRLLNGFATEREGFSTGGVDYALVDVGVLQANVRDISEYIPQDILDLAQEYGTSIVPLAIEHNGDRVSDAIWPMLIAERLGIVQTDRPFMASYVSPIEVDLETAWEEIGKLGIRYERDKGEGIVPLVWILDEERGIKTGALLTIASSEERLKQVHEISLAALRNSGVIK